MGVARSIGKNGRGSKDSHKPSVHETDRAEFQTIQFINFVPGSICPVIPSVRERAPTKVIMFSHMARSSGLMKRKLGVFEP